MHGGSYAAGETDVIVNSDGRDSHPRGNSVSAESKCVLSH